MCWSAWLCVQGREEIGTLFVQCSSLPASLHALLPPILPAFPALLPHAGIWRLLQPQGRETSPVLMLSPVSTVTINLPLPPPPPYLDGRLTIYRKPDTAWHQDITLNRRTNQNMQPPSSLAFMNKGPEIHLALKAFSYQKAEINLQW